MLFDPIVAVRVVVAFGVIEKVVVDLNEVVVGVVVDDAARVVLALRVALHMEEAT